MTKPTITYEDRAALDNEAMIEAVARAIYDIAHKGEKNCYSWDDAWEPYQEYRRKQYYRDARAAINAAAPFIIDWVADQIRAEADATPLGHENTQRGASTYNWLTTHEQFVRALKERFGRD